MLLDIVKPLDKLTVRHLQSIVRIQLIESGCIDDGKKEITQFLCGILFILFIQFNLELIEFLTHLLPNILTFLPVEAHITGLILDSVGLDDTGQSRRHT